MTLISRFILTSMLACLSAVTHAQLVFRLNPAANTGVPGNIVTFNATIANESPDTVFLNGVTYDGLSASLAMDTTLFFANAPLSLATTESWTGDIFHVEIDASALPATYLGSLSILGGDADSSLDILATQNFLVNVLPVSVPESGHVGLIASGWLLALLVARRRRFRLHLPRAVGADHDE